MNFLYTLFQDGGAAVISSTTAAFALAAIGLNVHFGYTGLVNIGQAGFMLLGAYGFAIVDRARRRASSSACSPAWSRRRCSR